MREQVQGLKKGRSGYQDLTGWARRVIMRREAHKRDERSFTLYRVSIQGSIRSSCMIMLRSDVGSWVAFD